MQLCVEVSANELHLRVSPQRIQFCILLRNECPALDFKFRQVLWDSRPFLRGLGPRRRRLRVDLHQLPAAAVRNAGHQWAGKR